MAKREKTPPLRLEVVQFLNKWDKRLTFRTMKPAPPKRPKNLLFFKKWERSLIFGGGEGEGGSGSDGTVVVYPLRGSFTLTARGVVEIESRRASVQIGRGFSLLYSEEHLQRRAAGVAWNDKAPHDRAPEIRSGATAEALEGYALAWSDADRFRIGQAVAWSAQEKAEQVRGIGWTGVENYKEARGISWSDRKPVAKTAAAQWRKISEQRRRAGLSWSGTEQNGASAAIGSKDGRAAGIYSATVWGAMGDLIDTPGKSYRPQPRPPHEIKDAPPLIFCHEWRPLLRFGHCDYGYAINENKGYYIMQHTGIIYRSDDGAVIPAESVEVSLDINSYAWRANLTVSKEGESLLKDLPELTLELNHLKWRLKVGSMSHRRTFDGEKLSVEAASLSVALDRVPLNMIELDYPHSAQDMAYRALTTPFNTGFELDWRSDDWIISSGIMLDEQSVLSRINDISEAQGSLVMSDYYEKKMVVQSRYQINRWREEEIEPSYTISHNRLLSLNSRREIRNNADSVLIMGQGVGGVMANVIVGSGQTSGGQVIHKYITDESAARARGAAEINRAGAKRIISAESPLWSDIPELLMGDVVTIGSDSGAVTSIKVSAEWGDVLSLRYRISIEVHDESI